MKIPPEWIVLGGQALFLLGYFARHFVEVLRDAVIYVNGKDSDDD